MSGNLICILSDLIVTALPDSGNTFRCKGHRISQSEDPQLVGLFYDASCFLFKLVIKLVIPKEDVVCRRLDCQLGLCIVTLVLKCVQSASKASQKMRLKGKFRSPQSWCLYPWLECLGLLSGSGSSFLPEQAVGESSSDWCLLPAGEACVELLHVALGLALVGACEEWASRKELCLLKFTLVQKLLKSMPKKVFKKFLEMNIILKTITNLWISKIVPPKMSF